MKIYKSMAIPAAASIVLIFASAPSSAQDLTSTATNLTPYEQLDRPLSRMERGNDWLATNELKRAVEKDPSIKNRFNLATGYLRTGRWEQAKKYYASVTTEGQGKTLAAVGVARVPGVGPTFDVGMTAADRLLYIDWLQNRVARSSGAVSAELAATNASTGPTNDEVTDSQARALDRQRAAQKP